MNILLFLLIISLPLGVISRFAILPNVYIYLHDVLAGLILISVSYRLLRGAKIIFDKKILYSFLGFVVICFISLVFNLRYLSIDQFVVSLLYLVRLISYFSIIIAVGFVSSKLLRHINTFLIIVGLVFISFGFVQYFFYPYLRNLYYAGWDDHLYRLFSTFFDPNFAGVFLVLVAILSLGNLLVGFKNYNYKTRIFFFFTTIIFTLGVFLTYSRSAFISLIVGVLCLLLLTRNKILVSVIVVMFFVMFLLSNPKVEGLNPFRIASSEARLDSARTTILIIDKNPLIGVGFDAFRYAQIRYGIRRLNTPAPSNADAGTDNSYLFILATTGIVGFIFFLKFIYELMRVLRLNYSKTNVITVVSIPSFLVVLTSSLFINALFYPLILSWVLILVGVTVNKKQ